MSGNTILKDGRSINENYGTDLDKLEEDDRVGVVRTSNGDLVFYVNGVSSNWNGWILSLSNLTSIYVLYGCYHYFHCALYTQVSQAVAASGLPGTVWAVVDLYGKCAAVTLTDPNSDQVRLCFFDIIYIFSFDLKHTDETFVLAAIKICWDAMPT